MPVLVCLRIVSGILLGEMFGVVVGRSQGMVQAVAKFLFENFMLAWLLLSVVAVVQKFLI